MKYHSFFRNKVVWITGASSGIGRELAIALARTGARLILSSRKLSDLELTKAACAPAEILLLPFDLELEADVERAAHEAWNWQSGVDVLFNNGGISQRAKALESSFDSDKRVLRVNLLSNIQLSKILVHQMAQNNHWGHLVITSSLLGKWGFYERSAYAASKHALHGYYESMRMEYEAQGLRVSILLPGFIATDISKHALGPDGRPTGEMDQNQANGLDPARCADEILRGVALQKQEIAVGGKEILGLWVKRFFPAYFNSILRRRSAR